MRTRSIKILGISMDFLRKDWREEAGGPVLRSFTGKLRAKVSYTGAAWRGTVWTDRGSSSTVGDTVADAQEWCEDELEAVRKEQRELALREARNKLSEWMLDHEKNIRQDAVQRSQAITTGKIVEHLVPYLPNFNYNPKDARFIGSPVDFVVFDGMSDDEDDQLSIVFVEVKTGMSMLTRRERMVRDAIKAGRVKWVEWHASNELQQTAPGMFE